MNIKLKYLQYKLKQGILTGKVIIIIITTFFNMSLCAYAVEHVKAAIKYPQSKYPSKSTNKKNNKPDKSKEISVQKPVYKIREINIADIEYDLSESDNKENSATTTAKSPENIEYNSAEQNIITSLKLNNANDYDFEVYTYKDGSFALPFKTVASLLEMAVEQNHLTKTVTFKISEGINGTIDYNNQKILYKDKIIEFNKNSNYKLIFIKSGLMESTKDEIFIPIKVMNEILDAKITYDDSDYSVAIKTNKVLKASVSFEDENEKPGESLSASDYPEAMALPDKKGKFTLDAIKLDSQSLYDTTTQSQVGSILKNKFYNYNSNVVFMGSIFNGDYELETGTQSYSDKFFSFGGLGLKYRKPFGKYNFELGELSDFKPERLSTGNSTLGISFGNSLKNHDNYKNESGLVSPDSKINVYLNDKLATTLDTQAGYYNLQDLPEIQDKVRKLKLEEVDSNGETRIIKEQKYPYSEELLSKGDTKFNVLMGMTGYNNRIFTDCYAMNDYMAKKLVTGLRVGHGITDKLTINTIGLGDYITSLPDSQNLLGILSANRINSSLILGSYKDFNPVNGQTGMISFDFVPRDTTYFSTDFGISHARSRISNLDYSLDPVGFSTAFSTKYKKSKFDLTGKIFNYSPNFYMAGTSGFAGSSTALNDKLGGEVGGNLNLKFLSFGGRFSRYLSNLDDYVPYGKITFNDYDITARVPIFDGSHINFSQTSKIGKNTLGKLVNRSSEINYSKTFTRKLNLEITGRQTDFNTSYFNSSADLDNFKSSFKILTAELDYDLPGNFGRLNFTHDIVTTTSDTFDRNYNAIRLGYSFPVIKGLAASIASGYHYIGNDKGLDFSSGLGYQFKSGRKLELAYNYNRQIGTFIDDIFIPNTSKHYFTLNFSDVISTIDGNIKSVGSINEDNGFIKTVAFLDLNQDGIHDKNEPVLPDIGIDLVGIDDSISTNKKGEYITKGIYYGLYRVQLNYDSLPGLLSISPGSKDQYFVKVDRKKQTKVNFGLISSVGNVAGKVKIVDEFNRDINIKDLVVVMFNEKGDEVKYTTLEDNGTYYLSGISPGKYTIKVDKAFIDTYQLSPKTEKDIVIPPVYMDYVDINDADLEYIKM